MRERKIKMNINEQIEQGIMFLKNLGDMNIIFLILLIILTIYQLTPNKVRVANTTNVK